jgi:fructose/tagatose bisphosphate aldolase
MLVPTDHILHDARRRGYAVGGFTVHTLEGVLAVTTGVSKFNVNTERRKACLKAGGAYLAASAKPELAERMRIEIAAMIPPARSKISSFGSEGKAT